MSWFVFMTQALGGQRDEVNRLSEPRRAPFYHSKGKAESTCSYKEVVKKFKTKANKPFLSVKRPLFQAYLSGLTSNKPSLFSPFLLAVQKKYVPLRAEIQKSIFLTKTKQT